MLKVCKGMRAGVWVICECLGCGLRVSCVGDDVGENIEELLFC